jgi:hypothetical protein
VATWTDVSKIMKRLREAERDPRVRRWRVADRLVVWERPLRKSDLEALGDSAPAGPILGVRVPLEVKEALLASKQRAFFTTPHFDGYPAILVHLPSIRVPRLRGLLESACRDRARARRPARRRR